MCTASVCRCGRCGTAGSGNVAAALAKAREKMLSKREEMTQLADSREKHVIVPK